jgi:hypothetical protein
VHQGEEDKDKDGSKITTSVREVRPLRKEGLSLAPAPKRLAGESGRLRMRERGRDGSGHVKMASGELSADSKEGGRFTVAGVGGKGRIYLRYAKNVLF